MKQNYINDFEKFKILIFEDNKFFEKLLRGFSVNVTTFFRNPEVFKVIKDEIVNELETYPSVKIWSAACSRGDEPYSLAILLDEMGLLDRVQIYATDFNEVILKEAQNGIFPKSEYEKFKKNYKLSGGKQKFEKWFDINADYIEVKQDIKNRVIFFKHNLVTDDSINEFNMIMCRNVLIYFDKYLQRKVLRTLNNSLVRDGFLILGESESFDHEKYDYEKRKNSGEQTIKVYRKLYNGGKVK